MKIYRLLAYAIAAEVVVQAAAIAFAMFGLGHWVYDEGNVATKQTFEEGSDVDYTGRAGFALHGVNGSLYIPLLAVVFLLVAVVVRKAVDGAVTWAAIVFGLVALQVFLGFAALAVHDIGALHGINAFALFWAALRAARRPRSGASGPHIPETADSMSRPST